MKPGLMMNVAADDTLAARIMPTTTGFMFRSPTANVPNPVVFLYPSQPNQAVPIRYATNRDHARIKACYLRGHQAWL